MKIIEFLICTVVYIIISPTLTIFHELGHVIVALICTNEKVIIDIGSSNLIKKIKLNRLIININRFKSLMDVSYGYTTWTQPTKRFKVVFILLGGPIMSLIVSTLLCIYIINVRLSYVLMTSLKAVFLFSTIQFLLTILPIKYFHNPYNGLPSDGYSILEQFKKRRIL